MSRFAPSGVVIESTAVIANSNNFDGLLVGPLRVACFLPVDDQLEETRRHLEEALWYLGRIQPLPEAQYRSIEDTNWAEAWKQHYRPIQIGRKLIVVPAWLEAPSGERKVVRIDPGMAFGTGTHPSTQLCLEIIEGLAGFAETQKVSKTFRIFRNVDVIDLGCGSGILAIAALKLGAHRALGVDIDADAIAAARENAELNGVADRLELGEGSLAEVLAGSYSLSQAPLVLANILAPVILRMFDEGLSGLVTLGGLLVVAGILAEQAEEITAAALRSGLQLLMTRQEGDWIALAANKYTPS